jgi:phytoene synthase
MSEADPPAASRPQGSSVREGARTHDQDRYLSALLAPSQARDDLVVLAAYIGEIKRIPLLIQDAAIGEIRLQWWRDALEAREAEPSTGHPIADALVEVARRRSLRQDLLLAPLEGFSRELYEDGLRDERELDDYAYETEGAAIRLALAVLGGSNVGGSNVREAERFVDHGARALALTRLALTLPQHVAQGRLPLPEAWVARVRDPRGLAQPEARDAVRALTGVVADESLAALERYRNGQDRVAKGLVTAFLPMCLIESYLKAANRPGRDALLEVADISPLSRVTRLWFAHWRGKI